MRRGLSLILLIVLLSVCLAGCGRGVQETEDVSQAIAVAPDADPPVTAIPVETAPEEVSTAGPDPTLTAAPTPTPTPTATPDLLRPGTYEGTDGSVLVVEEDGTCTYETDLSGTVNGVAMSGRLTFHGTVEEEVFTFTKITYGILDITSIAASAGFADLSYIEQAAQVLYLSYK